MADERTEIKRNKKLMELQRKARFDQDEAIKALVQHRQGRELLYWFLELCGVGKNPFTANALTTSFACGALNVGQQVQARIIEVAPASFLKMLTEKEEDRLNAARTDTSTGTDSDADSESDSDS